MKYDIVHVVWDDSCGDNFAWKSVEDAIEWEEETTSIGHTVGFLLFETDDYAVITLTYMEMVKDAGHSDTNIHALLRIPKSAIKEMTVLVKAQEE